MLLRERTLRRLARIYSDVFFVCLLVGFAQPAAAQDWLDPVSEICCPAPLPQLETPVGWSLFWHDPCGGGYRSPVNRCYNHCSVRPTWYASGEFVALNRDPSGSLPSQPLAPGATLLIGTGSFDAEFDGGARVLLGRSLGDWYRLEFSWLGSYTWTDNYAAQAGLETGSIGFSSRMNNGEINVRRRHCVAPWRYGNFEASSLVGVRYLKVAEDLEYEAIAPLGIGLASVDTDNEMLGVQIGFLGQALIHDRGWVDVEIKGAILSNESSADSNLVVLTVPPATAAFSGSETRTSFLGDLAVTFNYQFAPAWTFRAGYNAIWLTGASLASRNTPTYSAAPMTTVDHSGQVVYHGPSIGFVFAR